MERAGVRGSIPRKIPPGQSFIAKICMAGLVFLASLDLKRLPSDLRKKADGLLRAYGGLEGLSKNPPWLIDMVLHTWFTEGERKTIVEFLFQGVRRDAKLLILSEMGMK